MNELQLKIQQMKKEKNAVILAHFYQPPEILECADIIGDSLELAKRAGTAQSDIIVFCGVYFMAESAKILNPSRKVLIPEKDAGCPMANMISPLGILRLKQAHPDAAVVIYVNSNADCKAVSDVTCTSTNAVKVVQAQKNDEIIFVPDKNLGRYVAKQCPDKKFYYYNGCCPIHDAVSEQDVLNAKAAHPEAVFAAHPECQPKVLALADFVGSTAQIIEFCKNTDKKEIIVGTEQGIVYKLKSVAPDKIYHKVKPEFICPDMKKISLQALYDCLEKESYEVTLDEATIKAARTSLENMLAIG